MSRKIAVRTLVRVLALAAVVAGCGDVLGPQDVAGTYALRAPSFPPAFTGDSIWRLLADTFVVRADKSATKRYWIQIVRRSTNDTTRIARTAEYSYLIDANAIGFREECEVGAFCESFNRREWYDLTVGAFAMRVRGQTDMWYVRVGAGAP